MAALTRYQAPGFPTEGFLLVAIGALAYGYWTFQKTPPAGIDNTPNVGASVVTGLPSNLPRGIRNRNPGNIKFSKGNNWLGQMGKDSGGFVVFDTPAHGLRAMARLIKTYITSHGLNTISSISRRWSPDPIGLSGAYAAGVSKFSGVPATRIILPTDYDTIAAVMKGMIAQENGAAYINQYTAADLGAAARS